MVGPSAVPYNENFPVPKELDKAGIKRIKTAFVEAAKRALQAGFDVIEIHNAHGYLLDSFISPVSNKRTDEYGGSFENRIRLTLEIVDAVRAIIPPTMPLFLRYEWYGSNDMRIVLIVLCSTGFRLQTGLRSPSLTSRPGVQRILCA